MRFQRPILLVLILVCLSLGLHAQSSSGVLDPSRVIDWTQIGAGAIPSGTWSQCGSTLGTSSTASQINTALAGCSANQYVLLTAGTFNLTGTIQVSRSSVVLRGAGPDKTILRFGSGSYSV